MGQKNPNRERISTMKNYWCPITIAVVMLASSLAPSLAAAQSATAKTDTNASIPRLPNGKPDFSGNWTRPFTGDITLTFTNKDGSSNKGETNPLPFTEWGQAQWDNYNPPKNGDYAGSCMPFGWIRSFSPHPMQILQNSENIAFLFEQSTMFQFVNTEGLPHRKDWPPTWFGDSRGKWDGDTLTIDVVNLNGYAKLATIGQPMSDQAHLTMTFKRPDMGHLQFKWVLDDPKTYTRPISNERVFAYTPNVELMEYSCMEGNLTSLLTGAVTPWVGSKDSDTNMVYPPQKQWTAYDQNKSQKLTGVIKEVSYKGPFGTMKLDVDKKISDIVLAPPVRMDFRGLTIEALKPGITVSIEGFPSKQTKDEFRATTITINGKTTELR
jgi:hypothetical protein